MANLKDDPGLKLGLYGQKPEPGFRGGAEIVAAVLSVLWLGLVAMLDLSEGAGDPRTTGDRFVLAVAVLVPVALIWVAALALKAARIWRQDAARLQSGLEALRQAYVLQSHSGHMAIRRPPETEAPAPSTKASPAKDARDPISTRPTPALAAAPSDAQPRLPLDTPKDQELSQLSVEDFIRAMNFPNDVDDGPGFQALRRAKRDREAAVLLRASQDVLTLLSQDGIYMDDLSPDRARAEIWRRFADGERGRAVAALGGVRERTSLALVSTRMREDVIFRDATHHFLRHFDRCFAGFALQASDQEIGDLAETRTARAFMLLGRAAGTFD